jgi:2-desacetyl-2-hydroxyethyl bacteriochlorophyllide A dehydrogenase
MGQRIVFPEKGCVRIEPFETRAPDEAEVLVRTQYSLMSIGTETTILHARYAPDTHFAARFSFPQMKTGVQAIGEIEAVGVSVTEFRPGDRVFMRMAHTSHWTLPATQCSPVPSEIEPKSACWCGLAKTAFRAAHAAPFALGGNVLIIGAGPVGQMAIRWARAAGMQTIAVVDLSALRLQLATRGGATACFEGELRELNGLQDFDIVVDTTGNPVVFSQALGRLNPFGKLVLLGDTGYPSKQCLSSDMMTKGLTIVATHDHHDRGGWTQRRIDALFFKQVRDRAFDLEHLITHEFSPADCGEAYALASDRRDSAVGVLFDWTQVE